MRQTLLPASLPTLGLFCFLFSCQTTREESGQTLVLTNTAALDLTDKAVALKRQAFSDLPDGPLYPLLLTQTGDTIAAQLDDLDGDGEWDELFLVTDLPAEGQQRLTLRWVAQQPEFVRRTSVRFGKRSAADRPVQPQTSDTLYARGLPKSVGYQPYQTDGPSWENDKVGFRHYLDGRNAKDVFGKRTAAMSPDNVGLSETGAVEDNYHQMEDWGRDILGVGNSVGLGGVALLVGDQIVRLGVTVNDSVNNVERTTFHIRAEGPVRSALELTYHNWQPEAGGSYQLTETPQIWPGMYGYQNTVRVAEGLRGNEQLLVGLVNSNTSKPLTEIKVNEDWVVLLTHDQQTYDKEWWLGMALILPRQAYQGHGEAPKTGNFATSYYGKLQVAPAQPLTYYAVAGWELSDTRFRDEAFFREYVVNLAQQLSAQVQVAVE